METLSETKGVSETRGRVIKAKLVSYISRY